MPKDLGRWVIGVVFAIVGVFALFAAARAEDQVIYYTGLGVFVVMALFNFALIKQSYDAGSGH